MMCANKKTWTKESPLGFEIVTHEYKYLICERDSNGEPEMKWSGKMAPTACLEHPAMLLETCEEI